MANSETWDPHKFLGEILEKGELSIKNIKQSTGLSYLASFSIYMGWKYRMGGRGLSAIEKRCEKASVAPWLLKEEDMKMCIFSRGRGKPIAEVVDKNCEHIANLVSLARTDLPYLRALQFVLRSQHDVYFSGYRPTKKLHDEEVIEQIRRRYEGAKGIQMDISIEGRRRIHILHEKETIMKVYRRADANFIVHSFSDIFKVLRRIDRLVKRLNKYF